MDAILARKMAFLGSSMLAVWAALQAALISLFYPVVYVPGLFPGPLVTRVITMAGVFFGVIWAGWILFECWEKPAKLGMGKVGGEATGAFIILAVMRLGYPVLFGWSGSSSPIGTLVAAGTLILIAVIIIVCDRGALRGLELEAHTAGTKRLNGGTEPA